MFLADIVSELKDVHLIKNIQKKKMTLIRGYLKNALNSEDDQSFLERFF